MRRICPEQITGLTSRSEVTLTNQASWISYDLYQHLQILFHTDVLALTVFEPQDMGTGERDYVNLVCV